MAKFYGFLKAPYTGDFLQVCIFIPQKHLIKFSTFRRYYSVIYNSIDENILESAWRSFSDYYSFLTPGLFVFSASSSISR